jgi:predicted anti-sigma-YlaC factor YlaD
VKQCEEYQEIVSAYVDGESTSEETAEVFFHLGTCAECRTFMTSLLRLESFLQANEEIALGKAVPVHMPLWKRKISLSYPAAAAAIVFMLITGSLFFIQRSQPPEIINKTQTAYVYVTSLPPVDVVASPLPDKKTN